MEKNEISCIINIYTGGRNELFCYRVYIQAKLRGGFWIGLQYTIDVTFYLIRGERQHTRRNYLWQRKEHGKKQKKAQKQVPRRE